MDTKVELSPYRSVITPGGSFKQYVMNAKGEIHHNLTLIMEGLGQREPRTAEVYGRVLMAFWAWLDSVNPSAIGPDSLVDHVIRYLQDQMHCRCRRKGPVWIISPIKHSRSWIRVVLSALIDGIDILIEFGVYPAQSNPLRGGGDHRGGIGPFAVRGRTWNPRYRHDAALPHQMLNAAQQENWPEWAKMVLVVLFTTGCRVSEALELRLSDWLVSGCGDTLSAPNKGSAGRRCKDLVLPPSAVRLLHSYFDGERAERSGTTLAALRKAAAIDATITRSPIFVGRWGVAPTSDSFRKLWRGAAKHCDVPSSPHSARHWYVTDRVLRIFAEHGENPSRLSRELYLLVEHVHWANPEMLNVYAQTLGLISARDYAQRPSLQYAFDFAQLRGQSNVVKKCSR